MDKLEEALEQASNHIGGRLLRTAMNELRDLTMDARRFNKIMSLCEQGKIGFEKVNDKYVIWTNHEPIYGESFCEALDKIK